ncbi:tyrosine-type recombinase/integrase [Entomomonas asaccharolytica]|uniref:Tyrosine-type recombinase/integrase n=1 Tax=Entomomonas asaccharolytica TaxID=2785331 RepID=A0A974NHC8_9GAMM|nr:integrase arm-type DNA-binding domain-containing protein [Entomomonas asaccharolytica]QQP86484.1 tyrosine-type recombinase/integrase [Entomomonas asaccharolytica]
MARLITPLTEVKCSSAKPKAKDYKLFDGGGLYLLVKASGTKSWRMKFNKPEDRKESVLTFGDYPKLSIKEAREARENAKDLLAKDINPKVEKDNAKLKTTVANEDIILFETVAREWIKQTAKAKKWDDSHIDKMTGMVENYILPSLGNKNVKSIEFRDALIPVQTALNKEYFETATRVRQTVIKIMRLAVIKGLIRTNPALDLVGLTIEHESNHFPALPIERLGELSNKIYNYPHHIVTRYALILTQHIYIRSSELRFARWSEIDFKNKLWKIPNERETVEGVKNSKRGAKVGEYLVPLSDQVITLLQELYDITGQYEWIFTINGKKPLSENTINQALRNLGYSTKNDICGHGMRAMACSALNESGIFSEDAIEKQMSHQERKKVRRAYIHKAKHIQQRIKIMQWWSDYIEYSIQYEYIPPYEFKRN